jgi:hypothetical protein
MNYPTGRSRETCLNPYHQDVKPRWCGKVLRCGACGAWIREKYPTKKKVKSKQLSLPLKESKS